MATAKEQNEDEPTCPICLGQFNIPRQLPCAHTYCQSCLQSYITSEATKHEKLEFIQCPVCRQTTSPFSRNEATNKWASLFPIDTILQSILPAKSKVDRVCDACKSEGVSVTAEGFCAVCEEAMCGDCLKFHRKQKVSKNHTIITMEEISINRQHIMKIAEGFTCSEHDSEYIQFYCKDHNAACCGTCSFRKHKTCSNVIDFKRDLPSRLQEIKPENIVDELKKVESHLQKYMECNELNINDLESQVNGLSAKIQEIRRKINTALDELEVRIKTEGSQMYKEEVIRKQEENHECLSLMHAVRNFRVLLETVNKYGSDPQKFLMTEKMTSQLSSYYTRKREKCLKNETISIELEFSPLIESVLSLSSSVLGKIVTKTKTKSVNLTVPGLLKATKDCQFEKVDTIHLKLPDLAVPHIYGATFLPGNRVMLADWSQSRCIMLSSSFEFITSYTLTGKPAGLCVMDDQEVAVSIPNHNTIQILSVRDDVISPVRTITNQQKCYGIAATGKGEMVVTGDCGNNKFYWSLISVEGDVKSSHQYDSQSESLNYVAINSSKTRVYITLPSMNTLLCFDMTGKEQFTYNPSNLKWPLGVLVDRDDNIFVIGCTSSNIHHLSPDGAVIQVITTGVPAIPFAICQDKNRDMFIVTDWGDKRKLHIYRLK